MTRHTIHEYESNVASYNRAFPFIIKRAKWSTITDTEGKTYIDFFSGAGANNYGHNPEAMKQALIKYIEADGINNSLDMATEAKFAFIDAFHEILLKPRNLDYKLQFTGPTGTNAVEAALKLARKNTGRKTIISFHSGFHGVSLGALATTSNPYFRAVAGVDLNNVYFMDFDWGDINESVNRLETQFEEAVKEIGEPAGAIVECIQGEGGVNVARPEWLVKLRELTEKYGALLIVDDIQAGCGRSGSFFSFEESKIVPDIVTLSKSISGYGSPMSLVLIKPQYDIWNPAEHNGTFRGNNHAFVTAKATLETYWRDDSLMKNVSHLAEIVHESFEKIASSHPELELSTRGRGLLQGLVFKDPDIAARVSKAAFQKGVIIERAGPEDEVLKAMPALTIDEESLKKALNIIAECVDKVLNNN